MTWIADLTLSNAAGTGVLAIWHDIDASSEPAVIEWYNREHHAERIGTAGFRRVRRHVSIEGAPKYFIAYETDTPTVLSSDAYLDRANAPSAWSRQSMPHFRSNFRTVSRVAWRTAGPDGGAVATFRLNPLGGGNDRAAALQSYFADVVLPSPGLLKAQLWQAEQAASAIATGDKALRDAADLHSNWVVVLSAIDEASLRAAIGAHLSPADWERLGCSDVVAGYYQLQAALEKEHLTPIA